MNAQEPSVAPGKWQDKTPLQKFVWIGKLFVFLATFGFAYPNIMSD